MSNILEGLNPAQKEAAGHTEGPVLILAGAGSGKTKTLTHRLAYLILEKHITPERILAVTFTNKAAGEMKERVLKLLNGRYYLPWVGTFHSICVRILRKEAENAGISRDFVIYDEYDQRQVMKRTINELKLDPKQFNPSTCLTYISGAKNEMLSPDGYEKYANGFFQEQIVRIYRLYQQKLKENNALDFDDILMLTVEVLAKNAEVLDRYERLFQYILVDEYQDTNAVQYKLCKLLAGETKNICVVGDDYQCLVKGTKVLTDKGLIRVEKLDTNNSIITANGFGSTHHFKLGEISSKKYCGVVISFTTLTGHKLKLTPEHICYAKLQPKQNQWFVYLMYRSDKGYRIGITSGIRNSGKALINGLMVRANQERADKMWILKILDSLDEARYFEELYSVKYGIPKILFFAYKRPELVMSQKNIDALYREVDTVFNAGKLMDDLLIFAEFPHYWPQGTTSEHSAVYPGRCNVNLVEFGDYRNDIKLPWHAHRISLSTSNEDIQKRLIDNKHSMRFDKKSKRVETSRKHFNQAIEFAEKLSRDGEIDLIKMSRITENKGNYLWQPASHLRVGMLVPIVNNGKVIEDEIVSVGIEKYSGEVYDISVENVHNFSANGIIIHNSIYSWRGANFRNILDFEKDYPNAFVVKLEQNYRSTKNILEGADAIIKKNINRTEKNLWTKNETGSPLIIYKAINEIDEAEFMVQEARSLSLLPKYNGYKSMAILYRTNAQSRVIEEVLLNWKVPYKIIGGIRFYERKEVKDALAYLRLIHNPQDKVSLERVLNVPTRGIGEKSIELILAAMPDVLLDEEYKVDGLSARAQTNFTQFRLALLQSRAEYMQNQDLSMLIDNIMAKSGYIKWIDDGTPEAEAKIENIQELKSVISKGQSLAEFLEGVSLVSDVDEYDSHPDTLTLMTVHSAKGLEFPIVFMCGMEEGIFPHSRIGFDPNEIEEERRLCYVGITRAKERLYLIHAEERKLYGGLQVNPPSRFVSDLPDHIVESL